MVCGPAASAASSASAWPSGSSSSICLLGSQTTSSVSPHRWKRHSFKAILTAGLLHHVRPVRGAAARRCSPARRASSPIAQESVAALVDLTCSTLRTLIVTSLASSPRYGGLLGRGGAGAQCGRSWRSPASTGQGTPTPRWRPALHCGCAVIALYRLG